MSSPGIIVRGLSALTAASRQTRVVGAGVLLSCLFWGSGASPVAGDRNTFATASKLVSANEHKIEPTYAVSAGFDGEVFPSLANYVALRAPANRPWGVISVEVSNSTSETLKQRITVEIPGWSDQEIQLAELAAGERRTFKFAPSFFTRLFRNHEIVAATAKIYVTGASGHLDYETTVPLHLRSVDDMYWGRDFEFSQFIASWVTPHDPSVERVLSAAKESVSGRRLPGYEPKKSAQQQEESTRTQMKAVFEAVQRTGLSYVKSSVTFGENTDFTQRVRMPGESLRQRSANCIDGAVAYASLFENLGLDPVVVLIPGHAYVGVRAALGSQKFLFFETALTGRSNFAAATSAAARALNSIPASDVRRIAITEARGQGVYPMPTTATLGEEEEALAVKASKRQTAAKRPIVNAARRKSAKR